MSFLRHGAEAATNQHTEAALFHAIFHSDFGDEAGIVHGAELVLFIGCDTGDQVTLNWTVPAYDTQIVQIEVDPLEIGRSYPNTTGTVEVRTPANTLVAGTVSYDAASRTATLVPSAALTASTVYTATVRGGATDPRVKDTSGNALAAAAADHHVAAAISQVPFLDILRQAHRSSPRAFSAAACAVGGNPSRMVPTAEIIYSASRH